MRGIVLEEIEDKIIVLTKKGDFIKIDKLNDSVEIGEEIVIKKEGRNKKQALRRFASAAAVFMMIILGGYAVYGYYTPQGYISVDINSESNTNVGAEIGYNLYGKVIKLQALNKAGEIIVKKMGRLQIKSIDMIIDEFIKAAENEKVISKEKESTIVITIIDINKKFNDESMNRSVEEYVKENKIKAKIIIISANKIDYEKSKKSGISIGKIILINKAIKKNSTYKFDDLNKKSIEEIINIINGEQKNFEYDNLKKEKTEKEPLNYSQNNIQQNTDQRIGIEKEVGKLQNTEKLDNENGEQKGNNKKQDEKVTNSNEKKQKQKQDYKIGKERNTSQVLNKKNKDNKK